MTVDQDKCEPTQRCKVTRTISFRQSLLAFGVLALTMAACDSSTRQQSGSGSPPAPITASPAPSTGSAYTSSPGRSGAVVAVDARTGRQRWRAAVPMASVSEPVVAGGLVVVAGVYDCNAPQLTVAALQSTTGRLVWQRSVAVTNPCGFGLPLRLAGDVIVAGGTIGGVTGGEAAPNSACKKLSAAGPAASGLSLATGTPRWQAPPAAGEILAASTEIVIANGTSPGCVVGLDPTSGRVRWTVAPAVVPHAVTIGGGTAFQIGTVARGPMAVSAVSPGTGQARWQTRIPNGDESWPLAVGDVVVANTSLTTQSFPTLVPGSPKPTPPEPASVTTLTGLNPADGRELWQTTAQDQTTWTSMAADLLMVTHVHSLDRVTLEALTPRTGARRWVSGNVGGIGIPRTDGSIVVTYSQRHAEGYSAANGEHLWTLPGAFQGATLNADAVYLPAPIPAKNQPQGD